MTRLRTRNISRWLNSRGLGAFLPTPPTLNIWPWTPLFLPGPPYRPPPPLSGYHPITAGEYYYRYQAVLLMCLRLLRRPPPAFRRLRPATVAAHASTTANGAHQHNAAGTLVPGGVRHRDVLAAGGSSATWPPAAIFSTSLTPFLASASSSTPDLPAASSLIIPQHRHQDHNSSPPAVLQSRHGESAKLTFPFLLSNLPFLSSLPKFPTLS